MRVTDRMGFDQINRNLQKNRTDLGELQNQASTQKRVNKPSDDPVAAARVLSSRTEERGSGQFLKNIQQARSFLEFTDQSLNEFTEVLMRLKELAIQQANDAGSSADTRRAAAEEVEQTFNQAIQIGNRKLGERFIFGGFQTVSSPFDREGVYKGDTGDLKIHINKDAFVPMNLAGDRIFVGADLAKDGTSREGTATPKNLNELVEVQEGENEERIRRENEDHEHETVTLRAPASNATRGERFVEASADPQQQASESGVNILKTIKNFEIALKTGDKEEVQSTIDLLDRSMSQIIRARSQVGARIQTLNHTEESLRKAITDNKIASSNLEDADLLQVVSDINKTDAAFKATLDTSARLVQRSLLDFLK